MCNRASCTQQHELPSGHWQIVNRQGGAYCLLFFSTKHTYYVHLNSAEFKDSVNQCHSMSYLSPVMYIHTALYIYIYIYIYIDILYIYILYMLYIYIIYIYMYIYTYNLTYIHIIYIYIISSNCN